MLNKKTAWIIIIFIFFLSTVTSYSFFGKEESGQGFLSPLSLYKAPKSNGNGSEAKVDEPKTEECPINGEMLSKTQKTKWEIRRPLGVMIENHKEARPQSGLSSADVIFEAVAEGGITRFLSVFYCKDSSIIGPVRSARIYFVKLLQSFGTYPLYAHVGGANTEGPADALGYISELGWGSYNDLNQFSVPFPYFWRDYERLPNRATEHTVYSSTTKLWQYAKDKRELTDIDSDGKKWNEKFTSWKFIDDAKVADRGNITKIDFGFWDNLASDFGVVWNYDSSTNSYKRTNGGSPLIDKNTNQILQTKNIAVMFAKESPANDGYEGGHILYKTIGTGDAIIFQNGKAIKGTWQKDDEESLIKFYDSNDKEISIVRGQVFIEILPVGNKVTY